MSYSNHNGRPIRVAPMLSAENVKYALSSQPRPSSEYVKAVLRSYLELKFARGKSKYEVDMKLLLLEREVCCATRPPRFVNDFRAIRQEFGLPPSRALNYIQDDSLRRVQTTATSSPSRPVSNMTRASTSNVRVASTSRPTAAARTTTSVATTRPAAQDEEEMPPPPYASVDPEPESTRMLEERLAAEAENAGSVIQLVQPDPPPASTSPQLASSPSPPPESPARRPEHRPSTPPRVPSDEELRRIWEESQFDEAKRMSLAAERERQELEEAMRLSLAEAERMEVANSAYGWPEDPSGTGSNPAAGPSSTSYGALTPNQHPEGRTRRASSYNPKSGAMGMTDPMNDNIGANETGAQGITEDMARFNVPGSWNETHAEHQPQHSAVQPPTSLLDDDDQGTGNRLDAPMLTPMKTGAALQSNNPFLSPLEREDAGQSGAGPVSPTPQTGTHSAHSETVYGYSTLAVSQTPQTASTNASHLSPPSGQGYYPSDTPLRDSPGSSYTTYVPAINQSPRSNKRLPAAPGPGGIQPGQHFRRPSETYAPPPGPPPAHLRVSTAPQSPQRPASSELGGDAQLARQRSQPHLQGSLSQPPLPPRRDPLQQNGSTRPDQAISPVLLEPSGPSSYSTIPGPSPALRHSPTPQDGKDPLDMLKQYDTVFLIDDSASMTGARWEQAKNAIIGVADVAAVYDEDGIDVYFINSKRVGKELKSPADVDDLFAGLVPRGASPTGSRLEVILRDYMSRLERSSASPASAMDAQSGSEPRVKPMNLIVVTDGAPSDDLAGVIVTCAQRLDRGGYPLSQVRIQFFQIGSDAEAREAFQELDEGLAATHGVRDIVDTIPYTGETMTAEFILKTLLGGVSRRQERSG